MTRIILFISGIFASLWFGEARQGTIELFWVIAVLVFLLLSFVTKPKKIPLITVPNTYSILFLTILLPLIISTLYSTSPAYSLSFLLRTLTAWCLFSLIYSIPKKELLLPLYAKMLIYLGAVVALLSLIFRFFPHLRISLPFMNLIFSHIGHNQAINLLLILFPIAFHYGIKQKNIVIRWITFFLFPLAILFCFSRGAILIAGIYLLLIAKQQKTIKQTVVRWKYPLIAAFISTVFLVVFASFIFPTQEVTKRIPLKMAYVPKSRLSEEVRLSNWNQAIRGFVSHPILGTGPNTYILTSMHYHKTPHDGSGLAHNWYLQILSEVGILGALPIGYVLYRIFKILWKTRKRMQKNNAEHAWAPISLVDSVFLAFIYSLIDYNLDYFTLWILLWGTIAILLPKPQKTTSTFLSRSITIGSIVVLSVYVGTNLYANTMLNTIETVSKRFLLQPYDTNKTARYIEYKNIQSEPLTNKEQSIIHLWHKHHPDVLITLANAPNIISPEQRNTFYNKALALNPLNSYYYQSYLIFLYDQKQTDTMYTVFTTFINKAYQVTTQSSDSVTQKLPKEVIVPALTPEFFSLFSGTATVPEIASKILYTIGFSSLSTAPTATENLWNVAKDISPDWGLFHRELASYYMYIAHDELQAKLTLIDCQMRRSPAEACKQELELFPKISEPGSYKDNILLIPRY